LFNSNFSILRTALEYVGKNQDMGGNVSCIKREQEQKVSDRHVKVQGKTKELEKKETKLLTAG